MTSARSMSLITRCLFTGWVTLLLLLAFSPDARAQQWGTVEGRVTAADSSSAIAGAAIVVAGTNFGTATDERGGYTLRLPTGRYALRFSAVGYRPHLDSVTVAPDQTTRLDAALDASILKLKGVTVTATSAPKEVGVYEIDPKHAQQMPTPVPDGLRALKALPGVATNSELSNQYSVRGGGFNENLIFINGFEVFLPFRPRQGEQEGLSLLNPELAERITFYTGGFPARYGGKLSSALDVQYRRPENQSLTGSASLSTLDASLTAGSSALDNRLGWAVSARKARLGRLFGTQELKGRYHPDYTDLQGLLSYRFADGHELEALGMWAKHDYRLQPSNRRTYFGLISLNPDFPSDLQSLYTSYSGTERDGYETRFGGVRLTHRLTDHLHLEHDLAYFRTDEREFLDLSGRSRLTQVNQGGEVTDVLANSRQQDRADNHVGVGTWTGRQRWRYTTPRHAAEAGGHVRRLRFEDRIQEKTVVNAEDLGRVVVDSLYDRAELGTWQAGLYLQDAVDVLSGQPNRLVVTAGLRADYFSFNGEWTASPRLAAHYRLTDRTTLMGSAGVYHQTPTYRELRGVPAPGEFILDALNRDIQTQRSLQTVIGVEHFLPSRRLYLRAEVYYKHLNRLISYTIENVRVQYAGENDSRGFAYGLDLQVRGEFVPGLESWVNYSYLVARERFLPAYQNQYNQGLVPRPADQRHTFSLFVQDYIPTDPTWKLHLRLLFGSGLPYTPPTPDEYGGINVQKPGERLSDRYPMYKRADLGVTKHITVAEDALDRPLRLELTGEVLNLFDMVNTVSYTWTRQWDRIPTRLTPRTFNVRLRVEF